MNSKVINLTNHKYNMLTIIEFSHVTSHGAYWKCKCDCGTIKIIHGSSVKAGMIKSCGCLQVKQSRELCVKRNTTHNESNKNPLYAVWKTMRQRCNNPKNHDYRWYGAKGISICSEWNNYIAFYDWSLLSGYQKGLTIDRIDFTKGYQSSNCRWIPIIQQQKTKSNCKILTYNNRTQTLPQWADEIGLQQSTLWSRIYKYNWTIEQALTIKKGEKKR